MTSSCGLGIPKVNAQFFDSPGRALGLSPFQDC